MRNLYAYIDEAGDFNFKGNGSRHFLMTCVVTERPFEACKELLSLRYDLIERGELTGYFHASEDRQSVRDKVFEVIVKYLPNFRAYSLTIDKSHYDITTAPRDMYHEVFDLLIKTMVNRRQLSRYDELIVITDDIPLAARKGKIKASLKAALSQNLRDSIPYRLIHQRSEGDFNLQIADYFCWARFRSEERQDNVAYDLLKEVWVAESQIIEWE